MKLRIRGNSIRLRLAQGEVEQVLTGEPVSVATRFPGGAALTYRLACSDRIDAPGAAFVDGVLTVELPREQARDWAGSEAVSIRAEQPLDGAGALAILVEKDFQCLVPREGEDDTDLYPHPESGSAAC